MQEDSTSGEDAILRYDHNVVEHLGIRLYQNKIPNVIAELVSNSWDAGAESVDIILDHASRVPAIIVVDDGAGMNYRHLRDQYLVIGKPKRKSPKELVYKSRKPMGRKGIGKLAPFGIARTVDVITLNQGELNWLTLSLDGILAAGQTNGTYKPPFTILRSRDSATWVAEDGHLTASQVQPYIDRLVSKGSGTIVIMSALTLNDLMLDDEIRRSMADRYNIVLARDDFSLSVNGDVISNAESLPEFEFRIPESGFLTESVGGKDVQFWVGFVGSAKWSSEQAGVGVYSHGKIAQDRPFYFNSKGKEIFQRYLYAVVEADWLDEMETDVISTDRTGIDWAASELSDLKAWGGRKVLSWLTEYSSYRSKRLETEVAEFNEERRQARVIPVFTKAENEEIDKLVAEASRELDKGNLEAREELLNAVSKAWVNLPSRSLVKDLWQTLSNSTGEASFVSILSRLHEQSVPEAMGLALTFAQRAYALSVLSELVHRKSETKLQHLVEDFPWILQPRGDLLTANQHLKTTIEEAADRIDGSDVARAGRIVRGMTEQERADFVFLADGTQKDILIVEIKSPAQELTQDNRRQLGDYLDFTSLFHSEAKVTGMLVGSVPRGFEPNDIRITPKSWNEILLECRSAYVALLAGMLGRADPDPNDSRLNYVHEFGGTEVWELLTSMAKRDVNLKQLMERHDKLRDGATIALPHPTTGSG